MQTAQQAPGILPVSEFLRQTYKSLLPHETRLWLHKLRHLRDYQQLRSNVYPSAKGDFSLKPFDEHRCIFVHITKTAGTSVAQSLFGYLPYHYTAIDYRVIFGRRDFNRYFKFAFVRNPWDRLYSAFRYLKAGGWDDNDKLWAEHHLAPFSDFKVFVKEWLSEDTIELHRHFWPQHRFICDATSRILIDYLGYFETLQEDFAAIQKRLAIKADLGSQNINPGGSYRDAYDPDTRQLVADIYSRDIALFGYDFDRVRDRRVLPTDAPAR